MEQVDGSTESNGATGACSAGTNSSGGDSQSGTSSSMPMTYANLETLTRLNTEDLTSILSSTQHRHEEDAHYADASTNGGEGEESSGYIVATAADYHQGAYVVTPASEEPTNVEGVDESTTDNETSAMESSQLSVHSYCKPSGAENIGRSVEGTRTTAAELLDLKTVLPGPTTRRVLLIDDGHGDLEMAKSDVEFLLRGDAAGIVLREGKRSEVYFSSKSSVSTRKIIFFSSLIDS